MVSPAELRAAFERRLHRDDPPIQYHHMDLERIKDDRYLLRVLEHCKNDLELASKLLWHIMKWRKAVGASDINESNIRMDYVDEGIIFPHGRDVDGCRLVIIKGKNYVKGKFDFEHVKKGIIYVLDRVEREEDGNKVTLFFDLDGCGLQNMDLELIKFLVTVLTYYYPLFLNRIIVFQLPWILTAAFKVVKSFLRPEAVELLKFVNKNNLKEVVHPDQALLCWGGNNDYIFKFVPEKPNKKVTFSITATDEHFQKSAFISTKHEFSTTDNSDLKDSKNENTEEILHIEPRDRLVFKNEEDELIAKIKVTNLVENMVAFKVKTTSPEKFWVRPTSALIEPKKRQMVLISVLPGYQKTVTKDKFMIVAVELSKEVNKKELEELWKQTHKIDEYRFRCYLQENVNTNNNPLSNAIVQNTESNSIENKLDATRVTLREIREDIKDIRKEIKDFKIIQFVSIFFAVFSILLGFFLYSNTAIRN